MTRRLLLAVAAALAIALIGAAPSFAEGTSWWRIGSEVVPTHLPPEVGGKAGEGKLVVTLSDLGSAPVKASAEHPVTITYTLPAGVTATAASSTQAKCPAGPPANPIVCTITSTVYPYQRIPLGVKVLVNVAPPPGTSTTLRAEVNVQGAGTSASSVQHLTVSDEPTPFGVQGYEFSLNNEDGTPAVQAGAHPFQLTTSVVVNQNSERQPVALPDDLRFGLPAGLVGDPTAVEQCSLTDFFTTGVEGHEVSIINQCQPGSVVGMASATVHLPLADGGEEFTATVPVFNLIPAQKEPARLGFEVRGLVFVTIDTSVHTGGDYSVVASVEHADETGGLLSSQVSIWGVPGAASHNSSRGWECIDGGAFDKEIGKECPAAPKLPQTAFLISPGACAANPPIEPLISSLEMSSWAEPNVFASPVSTIWSNASGEPVGLQECASEPFSPSLQATPTSHEASTPTGLNLTIALPQQTTLEAEGQAEADIRDTTVTLPQGMQLNPSAANGLQACPEAQQSGDGYEGIGFKGFAKFGGPGGEPVAETATFTPTFRLNEEEVGGSKLPPSCPPASKVGIVRVKTPLLPKELSGSLYLAEPAPNGEAGRNPFNSLIALYLVAEDREAGVLVKLAGEGKLDQGTGQITTTFQNTPQLPFEALKVELFGGQRASLSTPPRCGGYAAEGSFVAWSQATSQLLSEPPFAVTTGAGGAPCPGAALAFSPSFSAGTSSDQAGGFSPFVLELLRPDGQQALTGVGVNLPGGVAAVLSSVTPCSEPPPGQEWSCGEASLVGHSVAFSGLGSEPVSLDGDVYLTTGYDGAPFGLLVRTRAAAGPFDLGWVNVRSRIDVNPETAAVTVTTDPGPHGDALPTRLKGVPAQIKRLVVSVDRPDFEFNPTNCAPMSITGSLSGDEGASAGVSSPFQVVGCQSLSFAPKLTATAAGHASKAAGTSFQVTIASPGLGQANIQKVDLQLPATLPARLSTLQLACTETVFNANPASCDEGSVIGQATVHTPILKNRLTGPAYLVSHGGAAFPDVEFVLQGEGIKLVLDGKTDIKAGITYSKFEAAPDAPFTSFETLLPAGPHSALTANVPEADEFSLCKQTLVMPTTITAQDGAVIEQNTKVGLTGCAGVLPSKAKKLTRAQLLAKAITSCRAKYKHKKKKRLGCEKQARKKYGPTRKTAHKAKSGRGRRG